MYQSVWRCRLCSQRFIGEVGFSEKEINEMAEDITIGKEVRSIHNCYGGSVGIADLQGFEYYDEKKV